MHWAAIKGQEPIWPKLSSLYLPISVLKPWLKKKTFLFNLKKTVLNAYQNFPKVIPQMFLWFKRIGAGWGSKSQCHYLSWISVLTLYFKPLDGRGWQVVKSWFKVKMLLHFLSTELGVIINICLKISYFNVHIPKNEIQLLLKKILFNLVFFMEILTWLKIIFLFWIFANY